MKPTVGRQVHYYSGNTFWHRHAVGGGVADLVGPFAATIVFVHSTGAVNLLICFPSACRGSAEKTELIEGVVESLAPQEGCWTWPPRS